MDNMNKINNCLRMNVLALNIKKQYMTFKQKIYPLIQLRQDEIHDHTATS